MSEMPEDIMQTARVAALDYAPGRQTRNVKLELAFARAILAERERCARIAERMLVFADTTSEADKAIPAAIRGDAT